MLLLLYRIKTGGMEVLKKKNILILDNRPKFLVPFFTPGNRISFTKGAACMASPFIFY